MKNEELKNYYSAFDLSDRAKGTYQLVYASQLYGTFFSVYGSFKTKIEGDECTINTADFEIINYKGPINLGLKDVTYCECEKLFHIHLQGMLNQYIITDVQAFEGLCLSKGEILTFKRKLIPLENVTTGPSNDVFDSEFYLRDGSWSAKRIRLEDKEKDGGESGFAPSPRCIRSNIVMSF